MKTKKLWYLQSVESCLKELKVAPDLGLSVQESYNRKEKYGLNALTEKKSISSFSILLEQFKSPLIYILIVAGLVTFALKEYTDSIVIFIAVIINAGFGYFQEYKAINTLKELKKILKFKVIILRNGKEKEINYEELVPGDIVLIKNGQKIPADGRLIETTNLKINESSLTGEWLSINKDNKTINKRLPLAERSNMVYMGSMVDSGKAKFVVTNTGLNTEFGKIASLIENAEDLKTPLQKKINKFSKQMAITISVICVAIFGLGVALGQPLLEMFTTSVAVAVAAIPEGLPITMTVILAIGMQRILKNKGLVRRLTSAETLGGISVIATDKTGTLTQAKMVVSGVHIYDKDFLVNETKIDYTTNPNANLTLKIGLICNNAFIQNPEDDFKKWNIVGNSTEKAIFKECIKRGITKDKSIPKYTKITEVDFNSKLKYSAKLYKISSKKARMFIMGAGEILLDKTKLIYKNQNSLIKFEKEDKARILDTHTILTKKGQRVIALGYKDFNLTKEIVSFKPQDLQKQFKDITFTGFISLHDPLRKEAKPAIQTCLKAGIRPIMITGDNRLTARSIANQLGMNVADDNIMDGVELSKITDSQFKKLISNISVFARVEPAQKLKIVKTLQSKGEVVAMTGDGINDAPALKQANIGVAVGSGTDVAKETADMVLLTDNFSVIVKAIKEGRIIIDNMQKVITFLFSDLFTEIILISVVSLLGFPLPITAAQILFVNLIEDTLPAIALGFEKSSKNIMYRKPQKHANLLTKEMKTLIFFIGIFTDLLLVGMYFYYQQFSSYSIEHIRTLVFTGLAFDTLFYLFACKSLSQSVFKSNVFSNPLLIMASIYSFLLLLGAIYLPIMQKFLKTVPLSLSDWGIIVTLGFIDLIAIEITKWYFNKKTYFS